MAFQLKKKRESINKTIRFPAKLVDKIDEALMGRNPTRAILNIDILFHRAFQGLGCRGCHLNH